LEKRHIRARRAGRRAAEFKRKAELKDSEVQAILLEKRK
jgi:hypothetical protein